MKVTKYRTSTGKDKKRESHKRQIEISNRELKKSE